ncbi:MAG TPA: patatin-like phospholipase family protein [Terriglobales bacterium]|nr:patatin-like phospholipase family protein [Terriglobales bacterium]
MPEHAPLKAGNLPVEPQPPQEPIPVTFEEVRREELRQIASSRAARGVLTEPNRNNLIGLAFSGGGIRSATFNLGVLQALAENQLLHKFDYLSTVSGGGYIGSWLAALTRRFLNALPNSSFRDVERALIPGKRGPGEREERTFLRWLRLYSDYLTPHTGLLSGDTWAMIGTWLRNVFLNQTVLGLLFLSIFVSCHAVLLGLLKSSRLHAGELLFSGGVACFIAAVSMAWNVADQIPSKEMLQTPFQRIKVTVTVILPFFLACLLLNFGFWRWKELAESPLWMWLLAAGVFYFVAWTVASVSLRLWREKWQRKGPEERLLSLTAFLFSALIAGAVGGGLGRGYCMLLQRVPRCHSAYWIVAVLGTGAVMLIMLLAGALHLGLAGRGCKDLVREWWARLGGFMMLLTLAWMFLAGSCAFGPLLVRWVLFKLKWESIVPVVLWIAHNYLGVKAANSPKTSGKAEKVKSADTSGGSGIVQLFKAPRVLDTIARLAPYVFGMGLVLLLTTAVHIGSGLFFDSTSTLSLWHLSSNSVWSFCCKLPPAAAPGNDWSALSDLYWQIQWAGSYPQLLGVSIILAIASLLLSRRVDVNDFSLHHFYRNRVVRCYLGASNPERKPQPFTGFDPDDDLPLKDFAGNYPGPYPILNAALNITGGAELGYATRRAKSFVFTPLYCGYDLILPGEGQDRFRLENAYQLSYSKTELGRTEESRTRMTSEGGIALGTAMAISGAAASPNMGYFTSPATGLFMTLFDVRLGWWMGNSRFTPQWRSAGPTAGLGYLFSELVAQSDQNKGYVYLSDGGHFENLAVYELIKRHCKVIVACDADCDDKYDFENLLGLIEKARTDFGARIAIDFSKIRPKDGRESEYNFAIGDIFYDPQNPNDRGKMFYVKASMPPRQEKSTVNEDSLPDDVWRYSEKHKTFPHQSTADQWFDELQFESYRALGQHIGRAAAVAIGPEIERALG